MTRKSLPVVTLVIAQVLSLSGTRLSMIAIPWLVLNLTGDPFLTGVVAFAEMLPYVIAKGLGGPFIDRFGARSIALAGEWVSVAAVAAIPALHLYGLLEIETLLPVVFLMGIVRGPTDAAKQALVPFVAKASDVPLERVTGLVATADRLATTLGAGAAGALVAMIGAAPALAFNATMFALAAVAVTTGIPHAPRRDDAEKTRRYLGELREGWAFLTGDAVLVGIVVMIALTNLLDQALISVMLPVWAKEYGGGPQAMGVLVATLSAFAVIGALAAARFGERIPRLRVYTWAFIVGGAPRFLLLLPGIPLPVILVVLSIAGFAIGFINPIIAAVSFERIPEALVGRVNSLILALAWILMPFGGLLGGASIALFGLSMSAVLAAVLYLAATMMPLLFPSFRALSESPIRG